MSAPPAWLADPTGRHQMRYWDGQQWTDHVSDAGAQSVDPVGSPAQAATAAAPAAGGSWMDKVASAANQAVDATSAAVDSAADSLSSKPQPTSQPVATPVPANSPAASAEPAAVPAHVDHGNLIADELTKLAALKDSGVLTEEEFAAQKAKLLGS